MADIDYALIKRNVSVLGLLRSWGWRPLVIGGGVQRGPCPLHGSKGPRSRSFAATESGWCCHGCKRQGDVIRLWAERYGVSMHDAAVGLCKFMGFAVLHRGCKSAPRNGEEERPGGTRGAEPPAHPTK